MRYIFQFQIPPHIMFVSDDMFTTTVYGQAIHSVVCLIKLCVQGEKLLQFLIFCIYEIYCCYVFTETIILF